MPVNFLIKIGMKELKQVAPVSGSFFQTSLLLEIRKKLNGIKFPLPETGADKKTDTRH